MAQWHGISRRKPSGGRKVQARSKRSTEISSEKQMALVGEPKRKIYRRTGGNTLVRVMAENRVSINNPKKGTTKIGTIHNVIENESDPNYVRRNILVKGALKPIKDEFELLLDQVKTASSMAFFLTEYSPQYSNCSRSTAHMVNLDGPQP